MIGGSVCSGSGRKQREVAVRSGGGGGGVGGRSSSELEGSAR